LHNYFKKQQKKPNFFHNTLTGKKWIYESLEKTKGIPYPSPSNTSTSVSNGRCCPRPQK